jgi:hypothetical protein
VRAPVEVKRVEVSTRITRFAATRRLALRTFVSQSSLSSAKRPALSLAFSLSPSDALSEAIGILVWSPLVSPPCRVTARHRSSGPPPRPRQPWHARLRSHLLHVCEERVLQHARSACTRVFCLFTEALFLKQPRKSRTRPHMRRDRRSRDRASATSVHVERADAEMCSGPCCRLRSVALCGL